MAKAPANAQQTEATRPIEVIRATPASERQLFAQVTALHVDGIHHGLLPLFGNRFLAALYRHLSGMPRAGLWCAVEGGEVQGFIAGCMDLRATYRAVLLRGGLELALAAGTAVLSPTVLKKLPSLLTYLRADAGEKDEPAPELLAMAVSESSRGRGVGRKLVATLEAALREWGIHGPYRVSTNVEEQVSNAFYRSLGFTPTRTIPHHALTLQLYEKECR